MGALHRGSVRLHSLEHCGYHPADGTGTRVWCGKFRLCIFEQRLRRIQVDVLLGRGECGQSRVSLRSYEESMRITCIHLSSLVQSQRVWFEILHCVWSSRPSGHGTVQVYGPYQPWCGNPKVWRWNEQ